MSVAELLLRVLGISATVLVLIVVVVIIDRRRNRL